MSDDLIISGYDPGINSKELSDTISRLDREKSWADLSTIIVTPTGAKKKIWVTSPRGERFETEIAAQVDPVLLPAWLNLIKPPNNRTVHLIARGLEVGAAYSRTIENILAHPDLGTWKYLLTLEHDQCPPGDGLVKLQRQMEAHPEFAAISGGYWTKGPGGVFQAWGDPNDPVTPMNFRPQRPRSDGELLEACGLGMGFCLFRLQMFRDERLRRPWFRTVASAEEGAGTQDLVFWSDARKYGYRCAVDCRVAVGHWDGSKMW